MNDELERLADMIDAALGDLDADVRELAKAVGQDTAKLALRHARGEDVGTELPHVRAQALNLSVAAQQVVAESLREWAEGLLAGILRRVLGI